MSYAASISESLSAQIVSIREIIAAERHAMYALYDRYYGGSNAALFLSDLSEKDYALLLRDASGSIRGFSTLGVTTHRVPSHLRALFSGDTIIHHAYWGQQALAFNWLRFAGQLKAQMPDVPLYWFLIVKGHRTYRYLSAFSHEHYPHHNHTTPSAVAKLMHFLARCRFGEHYDENTGLVRFPLSRGHLRREWARVPPEDLRRPEVRYFLQRNPGFARGDELVCLTELTAHNLKPLARRLFLQRGTAQ
jgi:hypothetical protein